MLNVKWTEAKEGEYLDMAVSGPFFLVNEIFLSKYYYNTQITAYNLKWCENTPID